MLLLMLALLTAPANAGEEPLARAFGAARAATALPARPTAAMPDLFPPSQDQPQEPDLGELFRSGPWGAFKGEPFDWVKPNTLPGPVNTGFKALGGAGQAGKVDGPGSQGNGTYRVEKSDPFELRLWLHTGYMDARLTLKRDQALGADTMRFEGRMFENGRWSDHKDTTNPVIVTYDAGKDRGLIKWKENGAWKQEGYWGGGRGGSEMTIEFGGGWDHDFEQD